MAEGSRCKPIQNEIRNNNYTLDTLFITNQKITYRRLYFILNRTSLDVRSQACVRELYCSHVLPLSRLVIPTIYRN